MTRHELPYISDYWDADGNPTTSEYRRRRMAGETQEEAKRSHQVPPGQRLGRERDLKQLFAVRQPPLGHTNQARHIRAVRQMAQEFSAIVFDNTPECADQSVALRKIREAVLWAEEAIHLEGLV